MICQLSFWRKPLTKKSSTSKNSFRIVSSPPMSSLCKISASSWARTTCSAKTNFKMRFKNWKLKIPPLDKKLPIIWYKIRTSNKWSTNSSTKRNSINNNSTNLSVKSNTKNTKFSMKSIPTNIFWRKTNNFNEETTNLMSKLAISKNKFTKYTRNFTNAPNKSKN